MKREAEKSMSLYACTNKSCTGNVGYLGTGFGYFVNRFAHTGGQSPNYKNQDEPS